MERGNHQCNAANLYQSKAQFQLELSLAQFSPSLFYSDSPLLSYGMIQKFPITVIFRALVLLAPPR